MAFMRDWTDSRDGVLWMLRRGFLVGPGASRLFFTRGAERRTVLLEDEADLDSLTDEELEALLDQAQRVRGADA